LNQAKGNILGVVLNDVDIRHGEYYGYHYGYRYRAYRYEAAPEGNEARGTTQPPTV
jgi:hypothetical protein